MSGVLLLLLGLAVGALGVFVVLRARLSRLERERVELSAALGLERQVAGERAALKEEVAGAVQLLTAEALESLQRESRDDLDRRQKAVAQMVAPLKESLDKVDGGVRELEKARSEAYGALRTQLGSLAETQERLRSETANLVTALRAPAVRGRWGEMQLRRVVEAAGMVGYCDFDEQATTANDGRVLRPDLVIRLPGAKQVVVDAKTPLAAYLDAHEATDPDRQRELLRDHARQLRDHVSKLSAKAYWDQFEASPDFVVLFVPGDPLLAAALDQDPRLQEDAWRQRVVLATPSTLIGLLFVVAYGWRQERVAESARAVSELGKELYERLQTLAGHFVKLRKGLETAVGAYNEAAGSLERRVLVTARRFDDLGIPGAGEIPVPEPIERGPRALQAPELAGDVVQAPARELPGGLLDRSEDVPDAA